MERSELFDIVGLKPHFEDDIIPDGEMHMVYMPNPNPELYPDLGYVAIALKGHQWDFLYWIYRLENSPENFKKWVQEFINHPA